MSFYTYFYAFGKSKFKNVSFPGGFFYGPEKTPYLDIFEAAKSYTLESL